MKKQWSCVLFSLVVLNSYAQEGSKSTPTMLVTASRMAESTEKVLSAYTVVTSEDIERMQASSILDVLSMQPGVNIRTSGGRGTTSYTSIRGDSSSHTLVLVDGVRAMSATAGGSSISFLPVSMVERIEIIRGPRAVQYGADAMAGVINIITKPEPGEEQLRLKAGMGNRGYGQGSVRYVHQINQAMQLQASVNEERSDGYNFKPTSTLDHDYGYDTQQALVGGSYQINPKLQLHGKAILNRGHSEYNIAGFLGSPDSVAKTDLFQQFYVLGGDYQNDTYHSDLNVSYGIDDSRDHAYHTRYVTQRYALNWINRWQFRPHWQLSGGIDGRNDDVGRSSQSYDETRRYNVAVFSQLGFDNGDYLANVSVRQDHNQRYGNDTTFGAAAGWNYLPHQQVKLSYATAFKAPNFNDLYYPGFSNPKLDPEHSNTLELGFIGNNAWFNYEVNLYQSWYRDLVSSPAPTYIPSNVSKARISGSEFILSGNTGPIQQKLSYVYQYGEDENTHRQLRYVPQHSVKWQMDWDLAHWHLHSGLKWIAKQYADVSNSVQMPSYMTLNLAVGYQITSRFKVNASAHNVLDRHYDSQSTYRAPGIDTRLNATYDF
ncbi:TonB-dependent receptor domain-containing protein [Celerinatantimonas sp. YJH-8]|uniref:TonB-dependent receptor domain-containing protein n=1 Tax=Celerinatantimonas sp. YJH-8 TaxID=3228714 RepID=UPI0038C50755